MISMLGFISLIKDNSNEPITHYPYSAKIDERAKTFA
jgi:hypothetical protein